MLLLCKCGKAAACAVLKHTHSHPVFMKANHCFCFSSCLTSSRTPSMIHYEAVQTDLKCAVCHSSLSREGLRSAALYLCELVQCDMSAPLLADARPQCKNLFLNEWIAFCFTHMHIKHIITR